MGFYFHNNDFEKHHIRKYGCFTFHINLCIYQFIDNRDMLSCPPLPILLALYCSKVHMFRDPYSNEEVASSAFCAMLDIPPLLYEFSSIVFFVVPMVSLVVMYSMMGWRVVTTARRRQSLMTGDSSNTQGRERTKKAVIEMLGNRLCFYSALFSVFLDF